MKKRGSLLTSIYDRFILRRPLVVLSCVLILVAYLGYRVKDFKLDASAETLLLEHDKDLQYSRLINSRYGESDYLVIAYTPKGDLFANAELARLRRLSDELGKLDRVSSILSILDIPLMESPPVPLKELGKVTLTLESPGVDMEMAKVEIRNSPIYQNLLVSPDLKTTALQIRFKNDTVYQDLLNRRNLLGEKEADGSLTDKEANEYAAVKARFSEYRDKVRKLRHQDIAKVREIMNHYRTDAKLFLGGVSMIADDMITFIKNDLKMFGLGVLFFLVVTLKIIFGRLRWIILPMLCCAFSCISMMGLLGVFGWEVTVISSNFVSLQLIITMAIAIHLVVRYRELHASNPEAGHRNNILASTRFMMKPCLFAALTTMAGFGSLVLCDILPVITFGWMMIAGIVVSLILTFILFPAGLLLFKDKSPLQQGDFRVFVVSFFAKFTVNHGRMIMLISGFAFLLGVVGMTRLNVENCFIDYFKKTTEIYQGMKVIDQQLGGTTTLDVVVDMNGDNTEPAGVQSEGVDEGEFDEFGDFDEFAEEKDPGKYWFTSYKMKKIERIHDYLDELPQTGKVLSPATLLKVTEKLNKGKPLDNLELALVFNEISEGIKRILVRPYVSVENNEVRFSVRVRDSEKSLHRNELLKKIRHDLIHKLGLKSEQVHLAGMLVMYNNMLQSLFDSQIETLGVVLLVLMLMFMVLFRSIKISLIAIFPNLMSIVVVLGLMGWAKIPLDMMTITIASISVGIAVDDTIHYIHRFKKEFEIDRSYVNTVYRCHKSIGYAMYFTSITIIIGFSVLVLSNFIPTIYFGFLTGIAMLVALIAALTLLPQLIIFFKPFGKEGL